MPTNNFQQWNPAENNQETDAEYTSDAQRADGSPIGVEFPSATANKLHFQISTMVAAIAAFMVAQGQNALDSNLSNLTVDFTAAITALVTNLLAPIGSFVDNQSGSVQIPGTPIIVKWGISAALATGGNNAAVTVNFPTPFPNNIWFTTGIADAPASNVWIPVVVITYDRTTSLVSFSCDTAGNTIEPIVNTVHVLWVAIGS